MFSQVHRQNQREEVIVACGIGKRVVKNPHQLDGIDPGKTFVHRAKTGPIGHGRTLSELEIRADEDDGQEIVFQAAIKPPLTEGQEIFTTAERVGIYLREHAADILAAAVAWSKEPQDEPAIKVDDKPSLVLVNKGVV